MIDLTNIIQLFGPIDVRTIIQLLWPFVGGFIGSWGWFRFFHKKENRLFKNLQRPVGIVGTANNPLNHEATLLKNVGFFNIEEPSSDRRAIDLMNDKRLVIIGYSPDSHFRDSFKAAKQRELPVIVYAKFGEIQDQSDLDLIRDYSHHSMCNTPQRLISDVFMMMSTLPEDKND